MEETTVRYLSHTLIKSSIREKQASPNVTFSHQFSYLYNIRFHCSWLDVLFRRLLGRRISQVVLGCQTFKQFVNKSHCLCKDDDNMENVQLRRSFSGITKKIHFLKYSDVHKEV